MTRLEPGLRYGYQEIADDGHMLHILRVTVIALHRRDCGQWTKDAAVED